MISATNKFLWRFVGVLAVVLGLAVSAVRADSVAVSKAVSEGFWAARVEAVVLDSGQGGASGWTRGPRYRLRAVQAHDEAGRPIAGFATGVWVGEDASARTFELMQQSLQSHLTRNGFVFSTIHTRVRPDERGQPAVDVVLTAYRGAAFKMADPVLRGTRTRPVVVRRLALWQDGENFDPARIERGLSRLGRLGYYESTSQEGLYRDSTRNVLYPVLRLPDARANTIGGLLGYDTEAAEGGKLTGFLDVRLLNMRGTARDFEFAFDGRTGREREVRAAYTEPWVLGSPFGARVEGRLLQQDTIFQEWQNGLYVFRDLDFTSRIEVEFGAQANQDHIADTRTSALISGVRVLYDSRDRAPFTREGTRGQAGVTGLRRTLEAGAAAGAVDSSYYVARLQTAAEHWIPLTDRFGLKGGFAAATNLPLNRLNHGELYDVGGARSLRGYRERQFQTNAYLLGDAEIQWSVGRRGRVFGFASPGLVNNLVGRYDFRRVLGYGAGLELAQGDWSVALTYALNPDRPAGDGYLHAAVENRF